MAILFFLILAALWLATDRVDAKRHEETPMQEPLETAHMAAGRGCGCLFFTLCGAAILALLGGAS